MISIKNNDIYLNNIFNYLYNYFWKNLKIKY